MKKPLALILALLLTASTLAACDQPPSSSPPTFSSSSAALAPASIVPSISSPNIQPDIPAIYGNWSASEPLNEEDASLLNRLNTCSTHITASWRSGADIWNNIFLDGSVITVDIPSMTIETCYKSLDDQLVFSIASDPAKADPQTSFYLYLTNTSSQTRFVAKSTGRFFFLPVKKQIVYIDPEGVLCWYDYETDTTVRLAQNTRDFCLSSNEQYILFLSFGKLFTATRNTDPVPLSADHPDTARPYAISNDGHYIYYHDNFYARYSEGTFYRTNIQSGDTMCFTEPSVILLNINASQLLIRSGNTVYRCRDAARELVATGPFEIDYAGYQTYSISVSAFTYSITPHFDILLISDYRDHSTDPSRNLLILPNHAPLEVPYISLEAYNDTFSQFTATHGDGLDMVTWSGNTCVVTPLLTGAEISWHMRLYDSGVTYYMIEKEEVALNDSIHYLYRREDGAAPELLSEGAYDNSSVSPNGRFCTFRDAEGIWLCETDRPPRLLAGYAQYGNCTLPRGVHVDDLGRTVISMRHKKTSDEDTIYSSHCSEYANYYWYDGANIHLLATSDLL